MGIKNRRKYPYEEYHRINDGILEKKCSICGEWFPCNMDYFYKNSSNKKDGLQPECRSCNSKKSLQWQYDNYEYWKEKVKRKDKEKPERRQKKRDTARKQREEGKQKEWCQKHPDKVSIHNKNRRHKNHKITDKEWKSCKEYFDDACAYCGMTYDEHQELYN